MSLGNDSDEMITLFVSFDIVNCTLYKSIHSEGWSTVISKILRRIISVFSNNPSGGYEFWKILGDEVIYTCKIGTVQELIDTLEEVYRSLNFLTQRMALGELCDVESSKILSIKATTWLADLSSSHEKTDNILTYYQINDKRRQADYIGPDIDTGFRTAKFSVANRLIISFEIACILMYHQRAQTGLAQDTFDIWQRVHLLTYKVLKGVWSERPYPILLYHGMSNLAFDDSISPQEKEDPGVLQEYWDTRLVHRDNLLPGFSCFQEQILTQLCQKSREEKVLRLMDLMARTGHISTQACKDLKRVCYTAVCYLRHEDALQFMIVKNRQTGVWGFGAASFFYNEQFVAQTEQIYHEELGVTISIQNDRHYNARIPLVVSTTQFVPDQDTYMSRTVFLGQMTQPPSMQACDTYSEIKLLSEDDIPAFQGACQPLFCEILTLCAQKVRILDYEKSATRIHEPYN